MVWVIAARELRSLFLSPLAWSVLAVVEAILAYLFLGQVDLYLTLQPRLAAMPGAPGVTEVIVVPLLGNAAVVLLLVIPLLTMRLIAEERRNQTLPLLFSAPVTMAQIVLGKYLGILGFLGVMLGLIALMPLSLLVGGSLDWGLMASGFLALALLLAAFASAGLYMSALTRQPTVAAVSGFGLLLLLWIIDWGGRGEEGGSPLLSYLSILRHYESLLEGVFKSSDVIYYLLFTLTFLILSVRRLDADRLPH